jgi:hypothetical protein
MNNWNMLENSSGITNMIGETFVKNAIGDSAFLYGYNTRFGGATAASDEGANNITLHSNQIGWMHGNLDPLQLGYTFGYADLPSGVTYLNSLGGAPYTGTIGTLSAYFESAPTPGTAEFVIATPNGDNYFTINQIIDVTLTSATGLQTFTPSGVTINQGQYVGLYVPSGNGPSVLARPNLAYAGAPVATMMYNFTASGGGAAISFTMAAPTTGATNVLVDNFDCSYGTCSTSLLNNFASGGYLIDEKAMPPTLNLIPGAFDTTLNAATFDLTAASSVPVSAAWGNVQSSTCSPNGSGAYGAYVTTTCTITLGSGSGSFVASRDVCLVGPFYEEAAVTAVGTATGGAQSVSFTTQYAWDSGDALMMQNGSSGGYCGQAMVVTSSISTWPISWPLVGATSSTNLYFSNCVGPCNFGEGWIPSATSSSPVAVTVYPMAVITGTMNGYFTYQGGANGKGVQLATNSIPFSSGDYLVGAPTSQYATLGLTLYMGQTSPTDIFQSGGIYVDDAGPYPLGYDIHVENQAGYSTDRAYWATGNYNNDLYIDSRPTANSGLFGSVIEVGGSSSLATYSVFSDHGYGSGYGGALNFNPYTGTFDVESHGGLDVAGYPVCTTAGGTGCGGAGSGVPSVNGITGAVTIDAGTGISVGTTGSTITVTNTEPLSPTGLPPVFADPPYNITVSNCAAPDGPGEGMLYATSPDGTFTCDPDFVRRTALDAPVVYSIFTPAGVDVIDFDNGAGSFLTTTPSIGMSDLNGNQTVHITSGVALPTPTGGAITLLDDSGGSNIVLSGYSANPTATCSSDGGEIDLTDTAGDPNINLYGCTGDAYFQDTVTAGTSVVVNNTGGTPTVNIAGTYPPFVADNGGVINLYDRFGNDNIDLFGRGGDATFVGTVDADTFTADTAVTVNDVTGNQTVNIIGNSNYPGSPGAVCLTPAGEVDITDDSGANKINFYGCSGNATFTGIVNTNAANVSTTVSAATLQAGNGANAQLTAIAGSTTDNNLTLNGNSSDTSRLGLATNLLTYPTTLFFDVPSTSGRFAFRLASSMSTVLININGVTTPGIMAPAGSSAPTPMTTCPALQYGVWVFALNGTAFFCDGTTGMWVQKIF